ncbi:hypothetical protein RF11_05570 [Thelohanellus kitauei]|uniref:Uncharacterized protein n=1 Tax=Thelohanellus kitauei TaxID=669202 RepID=A0A0C2N328_THEKT|nr:hypothetical protein RF11_05570 [Thelohanellus kitauei]
MSIRVKKAINHTLDVRCTVDNSEKQNVEFEVLESMNMENASKTDPSRPVLTKMQRADHELEFGRIAWRAGHLCQIVPYYRVVFNDFTARNTCIYAVPLTEWKLHFTAQGELRWGCSNCISRWYKFTREVEDPVSTTALISILGRMHNMNSECRLSLLISHVTSPKHSCVSCPQSQHSSHAFLGFYRTLGTVVSSDLNNYGRVTQYDNCPNVWLLMINGIDDWCRKDE